jgi:hypothetical protein
MNTCDTPEGSETLEQPQSAFYSNLLLVVVTFTWFLGQMCDRRGHASK